MTQTDLADMETSYPTLNVEPSVECGRGEVKLRPGRSMSAQSRVTSSLCRLEIPHWYRSNRSVSTTPSPPSWRREGRSRESSWRRRGGGTQSEAGESCTSCPPAPRPHPPPLSAGASRDSSRCRWSTYDPAPAYTPALSPGLMTSSYHSCQDSGLAGDKEDGGNMSTVKSTNSYLSYRQPYMGWRSLERLKLSGQSCLTPEQRLAASLLNQGQQCLVKLAAAAGADK